MNTRPAEACPACGGVTDRTSLRQVLPLLAKRHGAEFEIVGPEVQPKLREGIGGLLRYLPKQTST